MRAIGLAVIYLLSAGLVAAHFSPPIHLRGAPIQAKDLPSVLENLKRHPQFGQHQTPMNPGPVQPGVDAPEDQDNTGDGDLTISDVLPKTRSINIFASLTRDISSIAGRLESTLPSDNTTLLAPLNSAMQALPRKPWEDRPEDNSAIKAAYNEDKAAQNLQRFVEHHVVPVSPWKEGEAGKIKSLGGHELWWENRDGQKVIMPGSLVVQSVVGRVGNGEIWAVKGVVNYE